MARSECCPCASWPLNCRTRPYRNTNRALISPTWKNRIDSLRRSSVFLPKENQAPPRPGRSASQNIPGNNHSDERPHRELVVTGPEPHAGVTGCAMLFCDLVVGKLESIWKGTS